MREFAGMGEWHPDISQMAMLDGAPSGKVSGVRDFRFGQGRLQEQTRAALRPHALPGGGWRALRDLDDLERHRLLRLVRVGGAGVDVELANVIPAKEKCRGNVGDPERGPASTSLCRDAKEFHPQPGEK